MPFTAADRDGEVTLRLSPPELGVAAAGSPRPATASWSAHLQTETPRLQAAILENLPALRERLADQGVRIERFDVDLMQRATGGTPDQPFSDQHDTPRAIRPAVNARRRSRKPPAHPSSAIPSPALAG